MNLGGLAPPPLIMPKTTIPRPKAPLPFDLTWLDLEEFIPAGATPIQPFGPAVGPLAPEERTRYPSAEFCTAPDQSAVLFNDGYKYKQSIVHWLTLKRQGVPITNAVFSTTGAFDAMWSPNSSAFAVTHYVGGNASEVVLVRVSDLERHVLNLNAVLSAYFPARVASAPVFMKAYRWTQDSTLIVRGIGRASDEPHERFGCEVQVSFRPDAAVPTLIYLRGYVFKDRD